jgi:diguanylate cyclase (GGDEF)-like protein
MELCFQLKTNDFTSHIPILILGTNSLGAERLQWFNSGADVCLDTPYDPRELMARVQSLIRRTVIYDTITQLPTGAYLHQQLDAWLANNVQTAVLYADIDHYQAYVEQYGSDAGNRVIMRLAKLIVDALPYGTVTPAHLGNDDFMAMLKPDASRTVAQTLVDQFRAIRSEFYPDGVVPTQPLSLSVALVTNEHRVLFNYMQVSNLLSNTMRRIKSRGGDHWAE